MEENNANQTQTVAQPTQPKKSNVGLIIGIGCGVLALIGIIIIIIVVAIVILANSGKKLKCTYKKTMSGCTTYINADVKFKGGRANSVSMDGYVDCTGASYESTMLDAYEKSLKNQTNITNIKRSGSKITFDYKDHAGINISDPKNSKVGVSYDDAKKQIEKAGYTCE